MAESRFGALKGLKSQVPVEPTEPERPQKAGEGEGGGDTGQGRGRRSGGKRSNPDYERMNLLVRKDTRRMVDLKMLQEGSAEDLSELTDRLLREWAK